MSKNFEPYIDWDSVSAEMSNDMHAKLTEYKAAIKDFEEFNTPANCARVLKTQFELSNLSSVIHQSLFTLPVMVHIAGEKISEVDPEEHNAVVQRCTRCGSVLQSWCEAFSILTPLGPRHLEESDLPWWEPGQIVAKATDDDSMTMYEIEKGRKLEKHEKECVDLTGLEGES